MIRVGKWRGPLIVGLPLIAASLLFWRGFVHLNFEGQATLVSIEKMPQAPLPITLRAEAPWPSEVVLQLTKDGDAYAAKSLAQRREELRKTIAALQTKKMDLNERFNQILKDREALLAGPRRGTPRAQLVAEIEELKARRRSLIERYPTHTDIPLLAKQIQDLLSQMGKRPAPLADKVSAFDKQLNETKLRMDYFSRLMQEASQAEKTLKPTWVLSQPVAKPKWPNRVVGWPIAAGTIVGIFVLGLFVLKGKSQASSASVSDGLWKPEPVDTPVELKVVSPEAGTEMVPAPETTPPSDPMTEKAAALYFKWVDLSRILYAPAKEAPQDVLDQVSPLLQESSEFLPEGHDVMARYLARSVTPGDLAAHVARTVLMTLTGAQEAGVSLEHRLAMALAALFHDLAVVPRPIGQQENVGSEVGRLSASVLRRIPGLQPALLSMVEDILIGMDEFKLETWQNGAAGNTLEPLSKVLREIDRFEKVLQKQKSRLDRRVANQ